jgi:hypothetical protein
MDYALDKARIDTGAEIEREVRSRDLCEPTLQVKPLNDTRLWMVSKHVV